MVFSLDCSTGPPPPGCCSANPRAISAMPELRMMSIGNLPNRFRRSDSESSAASVVVCGVIWSRS